MPGGREMTRMPLIRTIPIAVLYRPQWSLEDRCKKSEVEDNVDMLGPEHAGGENHGEDWSREEDGSGVPDWKALHGLVDQPEEEAA